MRILVALDYSDCSVTACRWVLSRLEGLEVEALIFLHVLDVAGGQALGAIEQATRDVRRFADGLAEQPLPERVELRYAVREGRPADEVLAIAAAHKIDAIVMGTNSRTGLDRLLLGSVAESVVRRAPCTVIVVKPSPPRAVQEGESR